MKDKKSFGSFIKEKRLEKKYSQKELADLLFVTESAVSKWERGVTYPDITLISDICKVLDVTEHELIQSSNDNKYREIEKEAIKYKKIKKTIFWILNITYLVALLTCFIVNIAVNHKLSWFFIVLTSVITSYSFFPTFTCFFKSYKKSIFILSSFISMFILFLTCSIYTNNYWFLIPTIGVLLLYFIIFYPILFYNQRKYFDEVKFNNIKRLFLITYIIGILLLIILLLFSIHFYVPYKIGFALTLVVLIFIIPIIYGVMYLFEKPNLIIKIFTFTLTSIITILIIIGLCSSMVLRSTKFKENYHINDSFDNIEIIGSDFDINIYPKVTDDSGSRINCVENNKMKFDINVVDNTLIIKLQDERNFLERFFDFYDLEINLRLEFQVYNDLIIENGTGDIFVSEYLSFNDIKIISSTGDLRLKANEINNLNIKTSTGDIEINNTIIKNNVIIESSTGEITLKNVNCDKLDIKTSTGYTKLINVLVSKDFTMIGSTSDLYLYRFDANNINITLTTGDINGIILTNKIFMIKSSSGEIFVPDTTTGGICKIKTSTGNVIIDYYN